jgi:hypothetical protein
MQMPTKNALAFSLLLTIITTQAVAQSNPTFFATQDDKLYRYGFTGTIDTFVLNDGIAGMTTVPTGQTVGNMNGGATGGQIIALSTSTNNIVYRIDNPLSSAPTLTQIGVYSSPGASLTFAGNKLVTVGSDSSGNAVLAQLNPADFTELARGNLGMSGSPGGVAWQGGNNFLFTEALSDQLWINQPFNTSSTSIGNVIKHDYSALEMYQGTLYTTLMAVDPNGSPSLMVFGSLNQQTGAYTHIREIDKYTAGVTGLAVIDAVPEPATIFAALFGLGALAAKRRR